MIAPANKLSATQGDLFEEVIPLDTATLPDLYPALLHDFSSKVVDHTPTPNPVVPEVLTHEQKLRVILEDSRAGFVPAHHREKTSALTILAFLSDPETHPGGIRDHLGEIFQKHKNDAREAGKSLTSGAIKGGIAVQSVLFEYADNFNRAARSFSNLTLLAERIDNCENPSVTLLQELEDNYEGDLTGVAEFVRVLDTIEQVETEEPKKINPYSPGFDPFAAKIERFDKPIHGKNKTVHDLYSSKPLHPEVAEHIRKIAAELPVGAIRAYSKQAQLLERKRATFWSRVLRARYYEYQSKADNALATTSIPR